MNRRPPRSTRTDTLFPYTTLFRSKGEVVGLLGPNGAGKTTCFYSIMGLVKPDAGRIMLDGADITALPMYRRAILGLGYLPQATSIFRGMTRSEERRVGKVCVSTCRSRWST